MALTFFGVLLAVAWTTSVVLGKACNQTLFDSMIANRDKVHYKVPATNNRLLVLCVLSDL